MLRLKIIVGIVHFLFHAFLVNFPYDNGNNWGKKIKSKYDFEK